MDETAFKIAAYVPNISFLVFILFLVLKQNKRQLMNIYFSLITIGLIWWLLFLFIADSTSSYGIALSSVRAGILGPLFVPPSFYLFSKVFPRQLNVVSRCDYLMFLPALLMAFLIPTDYNVSSIMINSWGVSAESGPLYSLFSLYFVLMIILASVNFAKKYKKSSLREKSQILYVISGFVISTICLLVSNVLLVGMGVSQYGVFGLFSIWFFVGFTGYAIIRHGLFDVRSAAVRTFAYFLSLITLSAVYYGLAYAISAVLFHGDYSSYLSVGPINVALALLLAFIFQPVKRFFDKLTNGIFYKDNYDPNEFYARLNRTLTSTTDLRGLLERVASEIAVTLKSEQAFFFIHTSNGHFITAGTDHYTKMPRGDALELQIVHEMNYGLFIASLRDENDPARRLMVSHGIEMILPLKQASIIGYLCLGEHLTSNYTGRDIKVLNTIADELVIAIQNALAIQEIRELNTNLQQKINNATRELRNSNMMLRKLDKIKDEFVGIASHQLRTPLTSVKGYISMILDGDAGSITNTQRELLSEAYISSERMVHLINDFLNVSRLQTGKFIIDKKPTDLSKVVGEEIDSLRTSAASRNMEFVYRLPKTFPILDLDEGKMRQVIMNFADNSIYYSNEGTKIKIDLSVEGKDILFTVKDTGIGVPKSEQAQLFTKFYRASNARSRRPDGTGVGLFLAKKVIDAHHGQVVFESVESKGSTFGFRLPIAENKPAIRESDE